MTILKRNKPVAEINVRVRNTGGRMAYFPCRNKSHFLTDRNFWVESEDHPDIQLFNSYEEAEEAGIFHQGS